MQGSTPPIEGAFLTTTITLTTIGSAGVTIDVGAAALREAAGGVALEYALHDRPLVFALTSEEAEQIADAIVVQLGAVRRQP